MEILRIQEVRALHRDRPGEFCWEQLTILVGRQPLKLGSSTDRLLCMSAFIPQENERRWVTDRRSGLGMTLGLFQVSASRIC